jgi:hypothetical protein
MIDMKSNALSDADATRATTMPIALENIIPKPGRDLGSLINSSNDLPTANVVAELDALVADERGRPSNELSHLVLRLSAERAAEHFLGRRAHSPPPIEPSPTSVTDETDVTEFPYVFLRAHVHV